MKHETHSAHTHIHIHTPTWYRAVITVPCPYVPLLFECFSSHYKYSADADEMHDIFLRPWPWHYTLIDTLKLQLDNENIFSPLPLLSASFLSISVSLSLPFLSFRRLKLLIPDSQGDLVWGQLAPPLLILSFTVETLGEQSNRFTL